MSTDGSRTVTVVVPVYFNEGSLPELDRELASVEEALRERHLNLQRIFVDDGSGDESLRELLAIEERRERVTVIKLTRNFGAVQALKIGLDFVEGDCLMFLAADLQDPPELIIPMVDEWLRGARYVVCARRERRDPLLQRIFAALYYRLLRVIVASDYPAGGFDLALMDRAFLPHLLASGKNINMNLFAHWLGFEPVIIPYERRQRIHGKSRWTFKKRLKLVLDSLLGFSIVPIRAISLFGLFIALASFGYGSLVFFGYLFGEREVPGFGALATLISFLLGLVIIMLGILGEYVWRIADEVSDRPEAVIEEVHGPSSGNSRT